MLNDSYNKWLNGDSCCCNGSQSTITPDCDKDCSCEAIYLEISNVKTDVNVISGEIENKLDISAYTPVDLSEYYTKDEVDELIPTVPTNVSSFVNDAHYVTSAETANYVTSGNVETQITNHFYCC